METMGIYSFLILCFTSHSTVQSIGLEDEFTWSRINYTWPEDTFLESELGSEETAGSNFSFNISTTVKSSGETLTTVLVDYQYANNIPVGLHVWGNKLFVTVPRRKPGVPSTLNYVPLHSTIKHNVPLIPYPNWNINLYPDTSGNGDNLVSIYRIAIDTCDRMWFVDTGIYDIVGSYTHVKQPELILIDLQNDEIIHRVTVPNDVIISGTVFTSLTIDLSNQSCSKAFAYFPDLVAYKLIVYSLEANRFWRVKHNYFYLESTAGDVSINGYNFQWTDGVFSVELSEEKPDGFKDMYFHALAGTHMFNVSTMILQNETLATRNYHGNDLTIVGDKGPKTHTSMADIHPSSGIMFLNFINQNAVGCWNTQKSLDTISIVHKDDTKMIYPADVKVSGDRVYVFTNQMPILTIDNLDNDDVNFRVWSNIVEDAVKDTNCAL
ncbi:L-dopachrome tautomerase yellow-f2-like [Rhynchophorus ferrugineus]|uniref:L-dopachrome tautomerase yellow-f2-like n=1 Tax=Rhynchophorus ferrugineus TaxID=354439 RepID=UPI003FCE4B89